MTERIITPEVTSKIVDETMESVGNALEQCFIFLPFHRILEKRIPPLRKKLHALTESLWPFQASPDNSLVIPDYSKESLFDPVKEQILAKYEDQVSAKTAAIDPPKHLCGKEVGTISQSLVQELAQTAAQAACFALQWEGTSHCPNPYGLLLQIHELGVWRAGFYEDFDEQTKFFVFFPLLLEGRHCLAFFRLDPGKEISWLACDISAINNQDLSGFYPYLTKGKDLSSKFPANPLLP